MDDCDAETTERRFVRPIVEALVVACWPGQQVSVQDVSYNPRTYHAEAVLASPDSSGEELVSVDVVLPFAVQQQLQALQQ